MSGFEYYSMLLPSKSSSILSELVTELGRLKGEYDGRTSSQVPRGLSRDYVRSRMVVRSECCRCHSLEYLTCLPVCHAMHLRSTAVLDKHLPAVRLREVRLPKSEHRYRAPNTLQHGSHRRPTGHAVQLQGQ
jgi:hypothetical protein